MLDGGVIEIDSVSGWSEIQPLKNELPPVEPFEMALLPDAFGPWVKDIAERMQCPPDFAAIPLMIGVSSLIGNKVGIRPKARDEWLVAPNLWGGIVGRPSLMKSPAISEALNPLKRLEAIAREQFCKAEKEYQADRIIQEEVIKKSRKDISTAIRNGEDPKQAAAVLLDDEAEPPTRRRYVLNDSTTEALGAILADNPSGLLLFRDELIGLLKQLDKEGRETDRAFMLECWSGLGSFTYDRIGRGTVDIPAAILSVVGGIQPGPVMDYFRGALKGGSGDDGLMQRFQLLVWPDPDPSWKNVDRCPDKSAKDSVFEVFERLNELNASDIGAHIEGSETPYLRFDEAGQTVFNEWRTDLENRLAQQEEHPALTSHLAKYRSLAPSLALIIHLADGQSGSVSALAMQKAAGWCEYLESHARRLYGAVVQSELSTAKLIFSKIKSSALTDGFTARDVYRPQWAGLTDRIVVQAGIDYLIDEGYLIEYETPGNGRRTTAHSINPACFEV